MAKVHPNAVLPAALELPKLAGVFSGATGCCRDVAGATALTVWRKSLLFNCSGFTVYDAKGNLVFRVDNYGSGGKTELVLMDAAGKPLLTLRRKKLSLGESWSMYNGEDAVKPLFSVKRHMHLLHSKALAHVAPYSCRRGHAAAGGYEIEGSYLQRSCTVYDGTRRAVAEIRRKEAKCGIALGADVFRLVVQPDMDTTLAMGIVIALDQMYS